MEGNGMTPTERIARCLAIYDGGYLDWDKVPDKSKAQFREEARKVMKETEPRKRNGSID